jgi:putative acetyltransferase
MRTLSPILMIEIRKEEPNDIPAIRRLNDAAFGQPQEGRIVDALRAGSATLLSLVAVIDGEVVGHVLYSPASIGLLAGAALGPMAVRPDRQRQGIGTRLILAGNRMMSDSGCPFVIVVGHPEYYPRFGFTPASARGITCEWEVPGEAFMILVLDERRMAGVSGQASYRHEFSSGA